MSKGIDPDFFQAKQDFNLSGGLTVELMREVFSRGACFHFQVRGFSMSPFIRDKDIVMISPITRSHLGLGKVVACLCPPYKKLIVHRIVAKKSNYYLIKGDSYLWADCRISKKDVLGVVTAIEREGRSVYFGLGPERIAIALLSRSRLLSTVIFCRRIFAKAARSFLKCRSYL